jgi:polyvinyl alcohol dehydrogenase (cytochrome)
LGTGGSWGALDPSTGAILWQTRDPNGAPDPGAISVANGVVYGSSLGTGGGSTTMVAVDAATGATLWTYAADGSVVGGPSIANGVVYWGSGYSFLGQGSTGSLLYAFSLNGQ